MHLDMNKVLVRKVWIVILFFSGFISCKKSFNINPGTELDASQTYRNVYDADAAVVGIYGKFMSLADRYVIMNELRADLLTTTINGDESLRQISEHNVSKDNPYASPRPFYELILNCNDVLKNFRIMRDNKALKESEFDQRYSDIGCLRSFLYLQLGIHYGEVPYVTDALENVAAVSDESKFVKLPFNVLLDSLISFTDKLPFKEQYPAGSSLDIFLDGYSTQKFYINKRFLLGDLYLWKGNYTMAATNYRSVMETFTAGNAGETYYSGYKLGWAGGHNHYVSYGRAGDASTLNLTDGWRTLFETTGDGFNREWIWAIPYDNKFKPGNPLIKLFSPIGGDYLVKPSQEIIDNWNNQEQNPVVVAGSANGIPYDARWPLSVRTIGGQPVAMKYLYNYINAVTLSPTDVLVRNGRWFLYRQTHLHLRFAEAANRDRWHRLAYALFNSGIEATFSTPAGVSDATLYENTLAYPNPYKFDARNAEIPRFRSDWYRNIGYVMIMTAGPT